MKLVVVRFYLLNSIVRVIEIDFKNLTMRYAAMKKIHGRTSQKRRMKIKVWSVFTLQLFLLPQQTTVLEHSKLSEKRDFARPAAITDKTLCLLLS